MLSEMGVAVDELTSKGITEVDLDRFTRIVNLSEYPLHDFIAVRHRPRIVDWYVRDPYGQSLDAYRRARDAIEWLVMEKVPEWMGDDE